MTIMEACPPASIESGLTAELWPELRGVVERITSQNPENGYTVARLARE